MCSFLAESAHATKLNCNISSQHCLLESLENHIISTSRAFSAGSCAECLKMLATGWCVIRTSPVALYFPYCSSLSHLPHSGPSLLECFKSLFHCLPSCCGKQRKAKKKWDFQPTWLNILLFLLWTEPAPQKQQQHTRESQMLIMAPSFQQLFLGFKMFLMLKATFHP